MTFMTAHRFCLVVVLAGSPLFAEAGFFDSLANFGAPQRLAVYQQSPDKALVDAFYIIGEDGNNQGLKPGLEPFKLQQLNNFSISFYCVEAELPNMQMAVTTMRGYTYDSESDALAKRYVEFASERGNIVRLYRPAMGLLINQHFKRPFTDGARSAQWLELDNALIEFDPSGIPVSFLSRAHQAATGFGVSVRQYATIYFGKIVSRDLENNVKNSFFQENFIRDLKPEKKIAQPQND